MEIIISNKAVLVDYEDYEELRGYTWRISEQGYAVSYKGGKTTFMHRLIFQVEDGYVVDHINGNKLDNRKSNLRKATHAENMRNRKIQENNNSGFRGVHRKSKDKRWYAQIKVFGKQIHLGSFESPEIASAAYEAAADKYYGEFRRKS